MPVTKVMLGINALIIGYFALSFGLGPYSSGEQELWYRGGSLAFLVLGVLLPGGLVILRPEAARKISVTINVWLLIALFAFFPYLLFSGGGV